MKSPKKVTGQECLNWIDKPIGFADKTGSQILTDTHNRKYWEATHYLANDYWMVCDAEWYDYLSLTKYKHNINKRIVGVVTNQYDDGGYRVILLGDDTINLTTKTSCENYYHHIGIYVKRKYGQGLIDVKVKKSGSFNGYPSCPWDGANNSGGINLIIGGESPSSIDEVIDYQVNIDEFGWGENWQPNCISSGTITSDPNNTLIFGNSVENIPIIADKTRLGDPLMFLQGAFYDYTVDKCIEIEATMPWEFLDLSMFNGFELTFGDEIETMNYCAVPYNIILTKNMSFAQNYLSTGTLPPDAFLFPLDWENLPTLEVDDSPDDDTTPETDPDNDGGFDGEPDLPEVPTFTPSRLNPNNFYWLNVSQLSDFIRWFWEDVGSITDFDSLINKIEGLYNDLASTVLMVRYMPVDISWLGGLGDPSKIVCGMIEKNGNVDTIARTNPPIVEVGHIKVPKKFNSWASYSPYSNCSLYLPYYGFIEIDMDMFTGHDIYVKAIYDYISGTIQYLIYYENEFLVNSVVCKMAVDIPITLQSKSDRDSAIFQNVSNTVAGLMGAASTVASGNPLGIVVGANALTSGVNSAPLSVKGTVGEQGAFYAPSHCKLITRFPVQQKPSKFSQICGQQLNKTLKLNNDSLYGFTTCYNPRITFKNSKPLETEITEIYDYLEKGVIL